MPTGQCSSTPMGTEVAITVRQQRKRQRWCAAKMSIKGMQRSANTKPRMASIGQNVGVTFRWRTGGIGKSETSANLGWLRLSEEFVNEGLTNA